MVIEKKITAKEVFFFFFLMLAIFKDFIEFVTILFLFFFNVLIFLASRYVGS